MRLGRVLVGVLAVGSIAGCAAPAAPAAGRTSLRLSVRAVNSTVPSATATLRCNPTGGTHRHRAAACRALAAAGGRFSKLKGHPHEVCPDIVAPVTATATGTYRGRRVSFRHTYTNACDLDRGTAPVFAL
jgi:Subtilisin inhibitor-like